MVRRIERRPILRVDRGYTAAVRLQEDRIDRSERSERPRSSHVRRAPGGVRGLSLRRLLFGAVAGASVLPMLIGCGGRARAERPAADPQVEVPVEAPEEAPPPTQAPAPSVFDEARARLPEGHLFLAYLDAMEASPRPVHQEAARSLRDATPAERTAFLDALTTDLNPWFEARTPLAEVVAASMLDWRIGLAGLTIDRDFPDPFALVDQGRTYFYATNSGGMNVPVLDPIGVMLDRPTEALPNEMAGEWAHTGVSRIWAPSVSRLADGRFALFYSAEVRATGRMAVGVAFSDRPQGPFDGRGIAPLLRDGEAWSRGGVIDASPFVDAQGQLHLLFKNDGNALGAETQIWLAPLAADASQLAQPPVPLLGAAGHDGWEVAGYTGRPLIEGASLLHDGRYFLFFSANDWASEHYGVSYAVSDALYGPYVRSGSPWLQSDGAQVGPGGQEFFTRDDGQTFLIRHAWSADAQGYENGGIRRAYVSPVTLENGSPAH